MHRDTHLFLRSESGVQCVLILRDTLRSISALSCWPCFPFSGRRSKPSHDFIAEGGVIGTRNFKPSTHAQKKGKSCNRPPVLLVYKLFPLLSLSLFRLGLYTPHYTSGAAHLNWCTGNIAISGQCRSHRSTARRFAYYVAFAFRLCNTLRSHLCDTW